jgi:hypothetical protein
MRQLISSKPDKDAGRRLSDLAREYAGSAANVKDKIMLLAAATDYCGNYGKQLKGVEAEVRGLLVGQIRFLSQHDKSMNAKQKVDALLEIPPGVALMPEVKNAVARSYSEQTAYLNSIVEDILAAEGWARDYKIYSIGGLGMGRTEIRYDPPPSEILTERWVQDQKRDNTAWFKGDTVAPEKLPSSMARMAVRYFEAQLAAADAMGKSRNADIGILAGKLRENAQEGLDEARRLGESPKDRRAAHLLLVKYYHQKLQPALVQIGQEKYFDQLYSMAGGSQWKTALVWMHEHAQTGMLWTAIGIGAINPIAGRMAFALMGAQQVKTGVQNDDWGEVFMGGCMIVGMYSTGLAGKIGGATVMTGAGLGAVSDLRRGMDTGFTGPVYESMANNLVLLEGYFKSRMEMQRPPGQARKNGGEKKAQLETEDGLAKTIPKKVGRLAPGRQGGMVGGVAYTQPPYLRPIDLGLKIPVEGQVKPAEAESGAKKAETPKTQRLAEKQAETNKQAPKPVEKHFDTELATRIVVGECQKVNLSSGIGFGPENLSKHSDNHGGYNPAKPKSDSSIWQAEFKAAQNRSFGSQMEEKAVFQKFYTSKALSLLKRAETGDRNVSCIAYQLPDKSLNLVISEAVVVRGEKRVRVLVLDVGGLKPEFITQHYISPDKDASGNSITPGEKLKEMWGLDVRLVRNSDGYYNVVPRSAQRPRWIDLSQKYPDIK